MQQNYTLKPLAQLQTMRAYRVPPEDANISLALSGTERPIALALDSNALTLNSITRYPAHTANHILVDQLSAFLRVAPEQLLVTAGADEAIDRVCRTFLEPGCEILLTHPTFEMIGHYGRLTGATVRAVPWLLSAFPLAQMQEAITPATRVIAVVSPNNPTGQVISAEDLETLSRACPNAVVLLDLAYIEFADEDLTQRALQLPNVVMTRTFSKAWGLPGLRVGYAVSQPAIVDWMRAAGGPYTVAHASLYVAAQQVEQRADEMRAYVQTIRAEKAQLEQWLRARHIPYTQSQANFIFVQFQNAAQVDAILYQQGISIKRVSEQAPLADWRRITLPGSSAAFERLLNALTKAC